MTWKMGRSGCWEGEEEEGAPGGAAAQPPGPRLGAEEEGAPGGAGLSVGLRRSRCRRSSSSIEGASLTVPFSASEEAVESSFATAALANGSILIWFFQRGLKKR